jgi:hypothetical protein
LTIYHLPFTTLLYTVARMFRRFTHRKSFALVFACLIVLAGALALLFVRTENEKAMSSPTRLRARRMKEFPKLFVWAWERPEDLSFIDAREVGVAYLAKTLYLRGERVVERPRMQPLKVPKETALIAVVRIETARDEKPALSGAQREETIKALLEAARATGVSALQIDFDVVESERAFYKNLLQDLRARLPEEMPLSITALASWCIDDDWLTGLPVDEAVPMLFRMGLDDARIKNYLKEGGAFQSALCKQSLGISTDEDVKLVSHVARTYVFHTQAWNEAAVRREIERNKN